MKEMLFFAMCISALIYMIQRLLRVKASKNFGSIDAIVPAYNEEPCLERALVDLLRNRYIRNVIVVNDGSSDGTAAIMDRIAALTPRLIAVHQANTGKGGAIMNGLRHVTADYVFLSDADTLVPPRDDGLGYLLAEIENGADGAGGVPSSNLSAGGLLPAIRATVKLPMIMAKRTFQQILGGAPFIISGACGLFKADVLREVGMSDRTKVEDLDLTWTMITRGYKIRHCNFCVVYPQECHNLGEEWLRWRRWIMGYSTCMRLHWRLIFSRFGLFSILPMFLVVIVGVTSLGLAWANGLQKVGPSAIPWLLYPVAWIFLVSIVGTISAAHHGKLKLIVLAPLSMIYVLLAYTVWTVHGLKSLFTGRELSRDKPTRSASVVA